MTVYPAVHRHTFFSLSFSENATICIPELESIDMEKLRTDIRIQPDSIRVGCVTVNFQTQSATFPGIRLPSGVWFACDSFPTNEVCTVPLECTKKEMITTLEYVYHLFVTAHKIN